MAAGAEAAWQARSAEEEQRWPCRPPARSPRRRRHPPGRARERRGFPPGRPRRHPPRRRPRRRSPRPRRRRSPLADILGAALVTDGDTLRIGAERIRLFGIDAPETGQRCGALGLRQRRDRAPEATCRHRAVRCTPRDRDRYGRLVSTCTAGGVDLGDRLVSEGLARAYTRYGDDYAAAETRARTQELGLWRGPAQAPWDYRAAVRADAPLPPSPGPGAPHRPPPPRPPPPSPAPPHGPTPQAPRPAPLPTSL